nr:hypothetical protein CFP56_60347 [Quercus suber]
MDAYSIIEKGGRHQGSILVGRSGLDWTIACLVELCQWDFSKKHFFKWFHEQYKILEFSSRSNKSGLFLEISEYHNGARRGCLCVPEGRNKGGWAFFELKLREFFLGKPTSRPGKEVAAGGGGLEKSTSNSRNQDWKNLNGNVISGRELYLENQFPYIPGKLNQKESFGGFQNLNKHTINRHARGPSAKWTQAHFSLKIIVALDGNTQRKVCWSHFVKPKGTKVGPVLLEPRLSTVQAQGAKPTKAHNEFIENMLQLTERSSWEVGEGSGSHILKIPKLSPSTGELEGDLPRTDGCVDEFETHVSSEVTQISEGLDPHGSVEKPLMVFPGTGELGDVLTRSNGCGSKVGVVDGLPEDPNPSGTEVGGMGFSVMVADDQAEDFPNSVVVFTSGGQSVYVEPSSSPPLLVSGVPDMLRYHQMVGQNCFSPLSELGFDSKNDEILPLDWVNPTGSEKDEDSGNVLDCVPLSKWDPQGGMELVSEEAALDDFLVGEVLEPSGWVKRKI